MLVYAGLVPHSPLLLPTIGKENHEKLTKTVEAVSKLSERLYMTRPDTMVVISSHAIQHKKAFSINLNDTFKTDFTEFGDLSTTSTFKPDKRLIAEIRKLGREKDIAITLDSTPTLDFGTSVPLEMLTTNLPALQIISISYSGLTTKEHVAFGGLLKEVILETNKRVAVIASGDLSHCHVSDAPGGFHPDSKTFDDEISRAVRELSQSTLLSISEDVRLSAKACVYEQLLILFGILEHHQLRPEILSYEAPFGVGYLAAQFHV